MEGVQFEREVPFEPYCQVNVSGCGVFSLEGARIFRRNSECFKSFFRYSGCPG